jgi:microsomal dipeptidase-like Zn-dependent dipeptidase
MQAILATGGMVGAVAYGEFIDPNTPTLAPLADHIDYMVDVVGAENVGVGSDFTDYAADLIYSDEQIEGIPTKNKNKGGAFSTGAKGCIFDRP